MRVTEFQTIAILLGFGLISAPIISSLVVFRGPLARLLTLSRLQRIRTVLLIASPSLAALSIFVLIACQHNMELLFSGIAAGPVLLLGCMAIHRAGVLIAERVAGVSTEPDVHMKDALASLGRPKTASMVDKVVFVVVVGAIVFLTVLVWIKMR